MPKIYPYIHAVGATATATEAARANKDRVAIMIFNNEEANMVEVTSSKESVYGEGIPIEPKACYENDFVFIGDDGKRYSTAEGRYFVICNTGLTADVRIEEVLIRG